MPPKNEPVWIATAQIPAYSALLSDTTADVCVVGAGIAGLTTAYLLTQLGKSVVVIDDGAVGSGMTAVTTAHLANALDDRYVEIERLHGERGACLAAESHTAAIDRIEADRGAREDRLRLRAHSRLPLPAPGDEDLIDQELAAARRAGLYNVSKIGRAPLAFDTGPCLQFPSQAQFHPLKYLAGLARAIENRGGRIYTGTHAETITGGKDAKVVTRGGAVSAGAIVVATNAPVNDLVVVHTKQAPYMTYVIAAPVAARLGDARAVLGHRRSVPLHPPAFDRQRDRPADRRRRRSQVRPGRRHRSAPPAPRGVGARAFSRRWDRWRSRGPGR